MRTVNAAIVLMALAGCATKYQSDGGWGGGFSEVQLDKNVFKISFNGNNYTRPERAQELALLRSADLTLQHGYSYFVIMEGNSREDVRMYTAPVESTTKTSRRGNGELVSRTTTTGGNTMVDTYPTTTNTIMVYMKKPDVAGIAYDARFLCGSLAKKYQVTCGTVPSSSK